MSNTHDPGSTAQLESSLRYDIIKWKPFNFKCYHMWQGYGSAHIHFGHSNEFGYFTPEKKEILKEIKRVEKNTPIYDREKIIQPLIEENKGLFKNAEKKFVQHLKNIIDNSKQTFIIFEGSKLNIIFQYQKCQGGKTEDIHYLIAVADGKPLHPGESFDSNEPLKLITSHNEESEAKKLSERVWMKYGTSSLCRYPSATGEGVFLEFNKTAIEQRAGIFLKLFRHGYPAPLNDNEVKNVLKRHSKNAMKLLKESLEQEKNQSKPVQPSNKKTRNQKNSTLNGSLSMQSAVSPSRLRSQTAKQNGFFSKIEIDMRKDLDSIRPGLKGTYSTGVISANYMGKPRQLKRTATVSQKKSHRVIKRARVG